MTVMRMPHATTHLTPILASATQGSKETVEFVLGRKLTFCFIAMLYADESTK